MRAVIGSWDAAPDPGIARKGPDGSAAAEMRGREDRAQAGDEYRLSPGPIMPLFWVTHYRALGRIDRLIAERTRERGAAAGPG